jgi:hypothetical protein
VRLYVAVSSGFAWGVGAGGEGTGPERAIADAIRELTAAATVWGLTKWQGGFLISFCSFETFEVSHEQARFIAEHSPTTWTARKGRRIAA